ncbi:synaptosomal-associated protein 47 [Ahaetulla prasina]|uniref:synaptosomal-associated protein 47 n=1 Tax=Ahaetulla prasina TaxID=499056 RepID=UPI0026477077|nr:synaptosomal-associated protein 47 [Ahaetulla prasina]XP_058035947.1 synaptosomal-associated protein 47 [Ahaetulla prasina]XP_058035948.1 synaptosomal-associated protein 47 [Ahaetulla prasina]XP_058035949.1 synaptosomal-associated protein 47 [Ahaetulla prasina]XP_058035950.1 synaptosomal-associated protein 47 [Ahaetulla prasina]XP_058035951.1 synaptosomal-associated protein 47 [Ahaetulla prasina]XP_058035952.1 synaptosomal-associated protein 47 [Ahaetulla prasina]XP_058035953.1 synaptosom
MEDNIHIHAWSCSYYLSSEKQWVPGKLLLTPVSVKFTADKSGEILASFPLSSISEIKKESSTLIFSSLTLLESNTKHWFSSLQPNRNVIFNVLEHFWREQLLSPGGARPQAACAQTSKGKELTGLLMGSEKRLEDTAKVLEHQGEQFDNIMKGLDKIESEMDVADRLLSELESPSWWPFGGKLPRAVSEAGKAKENPAASPSKNKDGVIVHIPVIITERTDAHVKPGSLTLLVSGLRICDAKSQLLHWFDKRDVDDVRVHTPYEICVRQRFIGKPDICYRLLSAKMPEAIPFLEMQFNKKIQFLEDALAFAQPKRASPEEAGGSIWQAATGFVGSLVQTGVTPSSSRGNGDHQQQQQHQAQVQKEKQAISQSETQEIRQILRRLKCLALETETELERQDESLDAITSTVDRATMNIDRQNRRIRKLT